MIKETFGKKIGMTQMFGPEGELLPVTLVEVEPVCVLEKVTYQNKQKAKIGCFRVKDNKVSKVKKPQRGYFEKIGVPAYKFIKEVAIEENADFSFPKESQDKPKSTESKAEKPENDQGQKQEQQEQKEEEIKKDNSEENKDSKKEAKKEKAEIKESAVNQQEKAANKEPSPEEEKQQEKSEEESKQEQKAEKKEEKKEEEKISRYIGIEMFSQGQKITVKSKTKGKGFAGAIKRHKMHRQPSSHGSGMHRRVGSVGASATPSKIVKNKKMPGHLGSAYRVTKNLEILKVDKENKIIFIKGNVSGSRGTIIRLIKQS